MEDVYQIIVINSDVDSLKSLYLVDKLFYKVLNDKYTKHLLSKKFNVYDCEFKDFIKKCGSICIPNKSKHKFQMIDKTYYTHHNGEQPYLVKIIDNIVHIHTPGRQIDNTDKIFSYSESDSFEPDDTSELDSEESFYSVIEEDESDNEKWFSIEPVYVFSPVDVFIGQDPFNDHEDYEDDVHYNPNINGDPNFFTKQTCGKNGCICGWCPDKNDENDNDENDNDENDNSDVESDNYDDGYYFETDRSNYDGSNILLYMGNLEYIYISVDIYQFTAIGKIVNYISYEGRNDVPYAYAVDEFNNIYLFSTGETNREGTIIKMDQNLAKILHNDNDYFFKKVYFYYFFVVCDHAKEDYTKYIPIIANKKIDQ